jgi:hypothetical protein
LLNNNLRFLLFENLEMNQTFVWSFFFFFFFLSPKFLILNFVR